MWLTNGLFTLKSNEKHPRGLSKTKICIVVAIDSNKNMAMINNMCGWLKRYIWRFIGMEVENLQSYLNWFIYLQRCKRDNEKWPKSNRILRHLVLERVRFKRK